MMFLGNDKQSNDAVAGWHRVVLEQINNSEMIIDGAGAADSNDLSIYNCLSFYYIGHTSDVDWSCKGGEKTTPTTGDSVLNANGKGMFIH